MFGAAREAASALGAVYWPIPPKNADGTDLVENPEPFDQVRWEEEEHFIIGDGEEQNDPDYDGFMMKEQIEALHFETD